MVSIAVSAGQSHLSGLILPHRIVDCSEQDVQLLALSTGGRMRARLAGESVQLASVLTGLSLVINCLQLAVYIGAVSDELMYERLLVGRVLAR